MKQTQKITYNASALALLFLGLALLVGAQPLWAAGARAVVDGAAVYARPDMDSSVVGYLDFNSRIEANPQKLTGKNNFGLFFKIVSKSGLKGYVLDTDIAFDKAVPKESRASKKKPPTKKATTPKPRLAADEGVWKRPSAGFMWEYQRWRVPTQWNPTHTASGTNLELKGLHFLGVQFGMPLPSYSMYVELIANMHYRNSLCRVAANQEAVDRCLSPSTGAIYTNQYRLWLLQAKLQALYTFNLHKNFGLGLGLGGVMAYKHTSLRLLDGSPVAVVAAQALLNKIILRVYGYYTFLDMVEKPPAGTHPLQNVDISEEIRKGFGLGASLLLQF